MPVPKRKTSKSRRDMRSACKFIRPKSVSLCAQCTAPIQPHTLCMSCGFYKGRKVIVTKADRAAKRAEMKLQAGHAHHGHDAAHEAGVVEAGSSQE